MNTLTLTPTDSRIRPGSVDLELYHERLAQHEQRLISTSNRRGADNSSPDWRRICAAGSARSKRRCWKRSAWSRERSTAGTRI